MPTPRARDIAAFFRSVTISIIWSPASAHYAIDPMGGAAGKLTCRAEGQTSGRRSLHVVRICGSRNNRLSSLAGTAAIAERLWSPASVTGVDSMYARLEPVSRMLDWVGLRHRVNYEPMLERIAGERSADVLRVLADASEALGIAGRRDARHYSSPVPLNRFVDAVRPESEPVRTLELAARAVVAVPRGSTPAMAELRAAFTAWSENDARFEGPNELAGLSKNLSILGSVGLQVLEYLRASQTPPDGWIARQQATLADLEKPVAEVRLAAVRPVRILLEGAAHARAGHGNK